MMISLVFIDVDIVCCCSHKVSHFAVIVSLYCCLLPVSSFHFYSMIKTYSKFNVHSLSVDFTCGTSDVDCC